MRREGGIEEKAERAKEGRITRTSHLLLGGGPLAALLGVGHCLIARRRDLSTRLQNLGPGGLAVARHAALLLLRVGAAHLAGDLRELSGEAEAAAV